MIDGMLGLVCSKRCDMIARVAGSGLYTCCGKRRCTAARGAVHVGLYAQGLWLYTQGGMIMGGGMIDGVGLGAVHALRSRTQGCSMHRTCSTRRGLQHNRRHMIGLRHDRRLMW